MNDYEPTDEDVEPATWEDMQRLLAQFTPIYVKVIKEIADAIEQPLLQSEDIVYQYTTLPGLMGMIASNEIWTTSVGYLNDRTEYVHGQSLYRRTIEEHLQHPEDGKWKEVLRSLLPLLDKPDPYDVFVACFTSEGDQLSQWRGYAADGYGYSVGFATEGFGDIRNGVVPWNVIYDPEKQRRFCDTLLQRCMAEFSKMIVEVGLILNPEAVAYLLANAIEYTLPAFKHEGFREEREMRLFTLGKHEKDTQLKFRERNGLIVPRLPLTFGTGKLPIQEIIIGPNLDFDKAAWSLNRFLQQSAYEHIEIRRSSVPYLA